MKNVLRIVVSGACCSLIGAPLVFGQAKLLGSTAEPAVVTAATTAPLTPAVKSVDPQSYRIGPGDVLAVRVWKEDDASVSEVTVRADGKLTVPYVREIDAAGLTPAELEQLLTKRLVAYIHNPDVTVLVKSVHSQRVFVTGAVKKEGPIVLTTPLTVLEALMEMGGLTDYAKKKKIYVLRTENAKQVRLPFNYTEVIKGVQPAQNIRLLPGDVIVVPQ